MCPQMELFELWMETHRLKQQSDNRFLVKIHIEIQHSPVTLNRRSFLNRSSSICGAITAKELNTSIRANCCSPSNINGSSVLQFTCKNKTFFLNFLFFYICIY